MPICELGIWYLVHTCTRELQEERRREVEMYKQRKELLAEAAREEDELRTQLEQHLRKQTIQASAERIEARVRLSSLRSFHSPHFTSFASNASNAQRSEEAKWKDGGLCVKDPFKQCSDW